MKKFCLDLIKNYKNVIKKLPIAFVIVACSLIYAKVNSITVLKTKIYCVPSKLDDMIPFVKYFIIPYVIWYVYIVFYLFYYVVYNEKKFLKITFGIASGMLICVAIYYFFPTYVPRPNVDGKDFFSALVRLIYSKDYPYNCCPSIHVFETVLVYEYVHKDDTIKKRRKVVSAAIGVSIIISTLFIKQHYVIDVVTGIALAFVVYIVFNINDITLKYQSNVNKVSSEIEVKDIGE